MNSVPRRFNASQDPPPPDVAEDTTPERRARDSIVLPERVVPVPRYLLRYWHGLLSPSELMLTLGIRQAAFLPKETAETFKTVPLRLSTVGRWAGFTSARASDLLNKAANPYLDWFFQRQEGQAAKGVEARFRLRIAYPLSPTHQWVLHKLAADQYILWHAHNPQGSAAQFLAHLAERISSASFLDSLAESLEAEELPKTYASLADTLRPWFGTLSPEDRYLCQALETRIVQPKSNIVLTHYFIDHWLPELSSLEAVVLMACRMGLRGDDEVGAVVFQDVYEFARLIKVDNRTAKKIIVGLDEGKGALANFLAVERQEQGLVFHVQREDPLHPSDQGRYQAALRLLMAGAPLSELPLSNERPERAVKSKFTPARFSDLQNVDTHTANPFDPDGKICTHDLQDVDSTPAIHPDSPTHASNASLQNVDGSAANGFNHPDKMFSPNAQNAEPLINFESELKKIHSESKLLLQTPAPVAQEEQSVVVVNDWDITKILQLAGLSQHPEAVRMLMAIEKTSRVGEQFIARLIWAYERKTVEGTKGIDFPELYAVRHYREVSPSVYLQLAQLSPDDLGEGMGFYGTLREDLRMVLKQAWKRGLSNLIHDLYSNQEEEPSDPLYDDEVEVNETLTSNDQTQIHQEKLYQVDFLEPIVESEGEILPFSTSEQISMMVPQESTNTIDQSFSNSEQASQEIPIYIQKSWNQALQEIRETSLSGYLTFLSKATLIGYRNITHERVLIVHAHQPGMRTNGIIFPRFIERVQPILERVFQDPKIRMEIYE